MIAFDDVKLMGFIDCNDCVVNCVKVDVCHNQKLEPRPEECEKVAWYDWTTVMDDKRLMPNLRIIIPLMMADVDGWTLRGYEPTRGSDLHDVKVQLLLKQGFMSVKR